MNAIDVIEDIKEDNQELLKTSDHPAALVAGLLANKIVKLNKYIEYLERRLKHVRPNANIRN